MKTGSVPLLVGVFLLSQGLAWAAEPSPAPTAGLLGVSSKGPVGAYVLTPNDVVELKVYQEDDLETKVRIAKDGTASFPLIGVVRIGGKTIDQAATQIRELLDRDYLVNPQVALSVVEYAKRRFTVLGQVQRPGSYEIPHEESATLLQAIAMAGGFTRLANPSKVTLTRIQNGRKVSLLLDARSAARDAETKSFEVLPDDTITVPERLF